MGLTITRSFTIKIRMTSKRIEENSFDELGRHGDDGRL